MSLIAQYLFKDNANDETGNYNGTATNVTYENSPDGYSFNSKVGIFNGSSSKINLPNISSISESNSKTIEFWSYVQNVNSYQRIYHQGDNNNGGEFYIQIFKNNSGSIQSGSNGNNTYNNMLPENEWVHFVCTTVGNVLNVYINGSVLTSSYSSINSIYSINQYYAIGYNMKDNNLYLSGKLANFRIYNHALTATEIAEHYSAEKFLQPQVQFRPDDTDKWRKRFGDGSTQTIIDADATIPNVYTALPSCSLGSRPTLNVADGLYLLHQTRASDNSAFEVNWELNRVVDGAWQYDLTRNYVTDTGTNKAQAIKAATYLDLTIDAGKTLSPAAWNGSTGGVGVIFVKGTLTINGSLSASGKGFAGGADGVYNAHFGECYASASVAASSSNPAATSYAAGGGGMGNNGAGWSESSGGGGGHATAGTAGARALLVENPNSRDGYAGVAGGTIGEADLKCLYLGAGGGGGAAWYNGTTWYGGGAGGAGGGGLFIFAKKVVVTGSLQANGANGSQGTNVNLSGLGGGGAGGSILLFCRQATLGTNLVTANGGSSATNAYLSSGAGGAGRVVVYCGDSISGTATPEYTTLTDKLYLDLIEGITLTRQVR